jgi:very-short-patch-repair endonuclease
VVLSTGRRYAGELSTASGCGLTLGGAAPILGCMTLAAEHDSALTDLLTCQDGVLATATALAFLTCGELRWRIRSGRWQQPARGVVVAQSGPLTENQVLRIALAWAGPRAALGGLTAAALDGLGGFHDRKPFPDRPVHLVLPQGRSRRRPPPRIRVVTHYSRLLGPEDVHPAREPRRTRIARSLVDAAAWMPSDRGAIAVLAAGVQQRLVRTGDLEDTIRRNPKLRRRKVIGAALGDIAGGAQALSELDFTRQVIRRHRLPEPSRQMARRDEDGRRRWIDVAWDRWRVLVEIDGAQHMDALQYWDDMDRTNDLEIDGYRVLRFPAWAVRWQPEYVARKILEALRRAGCPC